MLTEGLGDRLIIRLSMPAVLWCWNARRQKRVVHLAKLPAREPPGAELICLTVCFIVVDVQKPVGLR